MRRHFLLLIIFIVGLGLRLHMLGERSFWGDEIMTVLVSKLPWVDFWRMRVMAPVLYLMVKFMLLFGEYEFLIRIPTFIAGSISILVLYKFASYLFNVQVGLMSAFMLATSVFHIHVSQEARFYSLLGLFSLLSFYFMFLALREGKRKYWIYWFTFTLLAIFTITPGYLVAASELVFIGVCKKSFWLSQFHKRRMEIFFWCTLVASIGFFIWFVIFILFPSVEHQSFEHYLTEWLKRPIHEKLQNPKVFMLQMFSIFWTSISFYNLPNISFYFLIIITILVLGLLMMWRRKDILFFYFCILGLPIFLILIIKPTHDIVPKHFIFWLPLFLILLSLVIDTLSKWFTKITKVFPHWLFSAFLVLIYVILFWNHLSSYYQREWVHDLKGMATILKESGKKGDLIIFDENYDITVIGIPYYLDRVFNSDEYWKNYGYHIVSIPQEKWLDERESYKFFDLYGFVVSLCRSCVNDVQNKNNSIWLITRHQFNFDKEKMGLVQSNTLNSEHVVYQLRIL